jgi:thioredoxin-related protein
MRLRAFPISLLCLFALVTTLLPAANAMAEEAAAVDVPMATDLSSLANQSSQRQVPILLMFTASDCDYCQRLEEDVIRPMMLSGEFDRRAILRKVMIDDLTPLKDFQGGKLDAEALANQRHVQVTPTLVFVDSNGKELVPKVVGYQDGVFYNAYLDQAIDVSQQELRQQRATH